MTSTQTSHHFTICLSPRSLCSYFHERETLKVIFHLVDSRHGPVAQDFEIMRLMASIPDRVKYVVCLTKADKRDNRYREAAFAVKDAFAETGCDPQTPVLLTSSTSRLGRDQLWRYLRLASNPAVEE